MNTEYSVERGQITQAVWGCMAELVTRAGQSSLVLEMQISNWSQACLSLLSFYSCNQRGETMNHYKPINDFQATFRYFFFIFDTNARLTAHHRAQLQQPGWSGHGQLGFRTKQTRMSEMAAKLCLQQWENNTELLFGEADSLKYAVMFCLSPSLA